MFTDVDNDDNGDDDDEAFIGLTDSASEVKMMMTSMIMNILVQRLVIIVLVLIRFFEIGTLSPTLPRLVMIVLYHPLCRAPGCGAMEALTATTLVG